MLALSRVLPVSRWAIVIAALTLGGWLATLMLMAGMEERSVTPLRDFPAFVVGWVIMLTAMMLPSELTYVGAFAALTRSRNGAQAASLYPTLGFVAGYGVAWVAYGLVAYGLNAALRAADLEAVLSNRTGPLLAGSVLIAAALYQVSSLKQVCLAHCRTPLAFFARNWREGRFGATVMGVRHGVVCVGCCWALMAVMFAVGTMNLTWMALLSLIMFAEKVLPRGERLTIPISGFLFTMGVWIAVSPETAPLLKSPLVFGGSICRGL